MTAFLARRKLALWTRGQAAGTHETRDAAISTATGRRMVANAEWARKNARREDAMPVLPAFQLFDLDDE